MEKVIYLTIDDAPSKYFKDKIEYLKKQNIPAIIFCIGKNIRKYEKDVIYAIKNGYIIGNHSFNHVRFSDIDLESAKDEIKKTDEIIDLCYQKAGVQRPIKLFRHPLGNRGGLKDVKLQKYLKKLGYSPLDFKGVTYDFFKKHYQKKLVDTFWTFTVMEYTFSSCSDIDKRFNLEKGPLGIERSEKGGSLSSESNEVMIIHDHEKTTEYFYKIIEKLMARGFIFKLPEI